MAFLGLIYDTVTMTLEVPPDKLRRTSELIRHWLHSPRVTKSDLQSLIGKLSHMCASISPWRIFIKRPYNNFVTFPTNLVTFRPAQNFSPMCAGGNVSSRHTTASPCCVHSLGFTNSFLFALTQTLLVLAAFSMVVSFAPPSRRSLM